MKFSNSDFHLMRWSLAAVCASILLSSVILYSSSKYADSTKTGLSAAQSKMNDARNRLTMARQDRDNLSDFSQGYDTLEKNKNHRRRSQAGLDGMPWRNSATRIWSSIFATA